MDALPLPLSRHTVHVMGDDTCQVTLAAEIPVSLVFNGVAHAVMMATPQDLDAFALGFALSEGIIDNPRECYDIEVLSVPAGEAGLPAGVDAATVEMRVSAFSFNRLKSRRRRMAGRTGCGVCGVESFAGLDLDLEQLAAPDWLYRVDGPRVLRALGALPARQLLNGQAGAIHAAGWATIDGVLIDVMEDVGRHNALDKLIGKLAMSGRLMQPGFVVITSRGSHELVRKCARLGINALCTVSAPTAMGVQMAQLTGVRLWGLCRAPRAVLYSAGGVHSCTRAALGSAAE